MISTVLLAALAASQACLPVHGDRIVAGDLASFEAVFAALPRDTPVGYAPFPGARRVLSVPALTRLAARHGLALGSSREICFAVVVEPLTVDQLRAAMLASLASPDARVEILEFSRHPVPHGIVEFPVSGLRAPPPGDRRKPALWRGWVRFGERRKFRIWARVRVSLSGKRVVAAEALPAGRPIRADQVRLESDEAFPLSRAAASIEEVAGKFPRRRVPAGAAVTGDLLAEPKPVSRGEVVRVEAQSGMARIHFEGRAEGAGALGETIPVRNLGTGKNFRARVAAKGLVTVGDRQGEKQ